ncbi:MAG TPA: LysR family transcriptional regulator [Terriglobales bacterium]|nr:LysR family transcriptional regulator [Terriglobales bacterium]
MDLFQLETFLAVAREGSFSRAAKKLYRTQPAVSQAVRKLEEELGEPLFDRSSREGILTASGKVLENYAEKLLNMRGEALNALEELRQLNKGKLSIAANELTCLYLLPVLNEFRRLSPMIKVTIQRSLASQIPDDLLNHNAELGVLTFRPEDPLLKSIVVYRDELCFVIPPNHPLATSDEVHIHQLGSEYFVAHHVNSPYREKVLETFQRKKVPLHMDIELPTTEAIKKFVAMGNGVALIPSICVEAEVSRGELVRISVPELAFERKLRLVYRKGASLSHAAQAFLKVAEAHAQREDGRYLYQVEK